MVLYFFIGLIVFEALKVQGRVGLDGVEHRECQTHFYCGHKLQSFCGVRLGEIFW